MSRLKYRSDQEEDGDERCHQPPAHSAKALPELSKTCRNQPRHALVVGRKMSSGRVFFLFAIRQQKPQINRIILHPGDNPGSDRWLVQSTSIQMLPPGGSICDRLTKDLPLGCLQGGLSGLDEIDLGFLGEFLHSSPDSGENRHNSN